MDDDRQPPPEGLEAGDPRRVDQLAQMLEGDLGGAWELYEDAGWDEAEFDDALLSCAASIRSDKRRVAYEVNEPWKPDVGGLSMPLAAPRFPKGDPARAMDAQRMIRSALLDVLAELEALGWSKSEAEEAAVRALVGPDGIVPAKA